VQKKSPVEPGDGLIVFGALIALSGFYLLAGIAWTLIVTGLLLVAFGVLVELAWR